MSRSYKKPYYTQQQKSGGRLNKRIAARAVRAMPKEQAPQDGKAFRKESNSWDIRDWSLHAPEDKKAYRK